VEEGWNEEPEQLQGKSQIVVKHGALLELAMVANG
jgi:hypothetical protein